MIIVAVLLLPVLTFLLFGLDQVEDRWIARPPTPHHARRRRRGRGRFPAGRR
ncbi:hypothetical protein [Streptomyces camelliae]|uniref:Uncharacterized protein n=1 Tax=Streptomyces camelliae TaxID=3004093 RepID=A0ABY7PFH3_9ACTN|nr:hypothetical protein [Streptomyces sp. HUAS 2-6]WBO68327.1 hypothetical protein O1G22_38685 [Streptomyces sp. HUAS 2-6]